jgi:hypothetical protein
MQLFIFEKNIENFLENLMIEVIALMFFKNICELDMKIEAQNGKKL